MRASYDNAKVMRAHTQTADGTWDGGRDMSRKIRYMGRRTRHGTADGTWDGTGHQTRPNGTSDGTGLQTGRGGTSDGTEQDIRWDIG